MNFKKIAIIISIFCIARIMAIPIPGIQHTLADTKTVSVIIATARMLKEVFPKDRYVIYSLGQSPAYIVKTLEMIEEAEQSISRCFYIPFSHSWLQYKLFEHLRLRRYEQTVFGPKSAAIAEYRKQLTLLGITPTHVIENYRKGKKTVLIDFSFSGSTYASFFSLFYGWAQDLRIDVNELAHAIEIGDISLRSAPMHPQTIMQFPVNGTMMSLSFNPTNIQVQPISRWRLERTDAILTDLVTIKKHERLIIKYPYYEWETANPQNFLYSMQTLRLLNYIHEHI